MHAYKKNMYYTRVNILKNKHETIRDQLNIYLWGENLSTYDEKI